MNARQSLPPTPSPVAPLEAAEVLTSIILRMGEILGAAVIYRLVHFAAVREGERIAKHYQARNAATAIARIQDLLRAKIHLDEDLEGPTPTLRITVDGSPHLHVADRGIQGLIIGLASGALFITEHRRFNLVEDPIVSGTGLSLRLRG